MKPTNAKTTLAIRIGSLFAIFAAMAASAEPPPPPSADHVVLNGACDAIDADARVLALLQNVAGARAGAEAIVHDELLACFSAEGAFYESQRNNNGTAGAAETAAYQAAVSHATSVVTGLLATVPSGSDVATAIGDFYRTSLAELRRHGYAPSVKAATERFNEALLVLQQTAFACDRSGSGTGTSCAAFRDKLSSYEASAPARIAELVPKVDALASALASLESDLASVLGLIPSVLRAIQATQSQVNYWVGVINAYAAYAGYLAGVYSYYVAWAVYFARVGNWSAYSAYLSTATVYGRIFQNVAGIIIPGLWIAVRPLEGQLVQLNGNLSSLQARSFGDTANIETTKARIRGLPLAGLN